MEHLLFSYGTLQNEQVQLDTFNRLLHGVPDELLGFSIRSVEITDMAVLKSSGQRFHPMAVISTNPDDLIKGSVFAITPEELQHADSYEVKDYRRIKVTLVSGKQAWIYIAS